MSPELEVRRHADQVPEGLDALAAAGGCFFQTTAWMRAVCVAEPRLRPLVIAAWEGGQLAAALPLLAARRFGTLRLYASAWGTYGGIVARTPAAAARVREDLERLVREPRLLLVRVHDFAASLQASGASARLWRTVPEVCQVLDLPHDPEALFHGAFTSQNRNKIRKAEKHGVAVRRAHDAAALLQYAALYRESARRWNLVRPLPESFFAALGACPEGVDVWLAERDGAAVAGLLNFRFGTQIMNWGNVSRREAWSLSPNNLLHWRAIEDACLDPRGPRLYNFGSSTGLPGVGTFKSAFGAHEHPYDRREHSPAWMAWLRAHGGRRAALPRGAAE